MSTQMQQPVTQKNFDPASLESGDMSQLNNWVNGTGSSIYVQWVPDEMTELDANSFFTFYGEVDRIEFVPKFNKDRKQIGRILFVHFNKWTNAYLSLDIANKYPEPSSVEYRSLNRYGNVKVYELKCRVNMRPIPKVEYTMSQITDMFERLNERVMKDMADMRKEIESQRIENEDLRKALFDKIALNV